MGIITQSSQFLGVFWQLRIRHYHCCGSGWIPGPGTLAGSPHGRKLAKNTSYSDVIQKKIVMDLNPELHGENAQPPTRG